jgi:hypothetical protein
MAEKPTSKYRPLKPPSFAVVEKGFPHAQSRQVAQKPLETQVG